MSSTNSTSHYNLPQFVSTDKPAWLTDFNGAMGAIDTGIYEAKTTADTANTAAGNADTKAGNAQQTANTALTNAGTAQSTADGNTAKIGTLTSLDTSAKTNLVAAVNEVNTNNTTTASNLNTFMTKFNLSNITEGNPTTTGTVSTDKYTLAQNSDGSIFKFYGSKNFFSGATITKSAIQGLSGYYGAKTSLHLTTAPTTAYMIKSAGFVFFVNNSENAITKLYECAIAVGTDGYVYMWAGTYNGNESVPSGQYLRIQFAPCIYFNTDFGDVPSEP